jgi:hypothetical protein
MVVHATQRYADNYMLFVPLVYIIADTVHAHIPTQCKLTLVHVVLTLAMRVRLRTSCMRSGFV